MGSMKDENERSEMGVESELDESGGVKIEESNKITGRGGGEEA